MWNTLTTDINVAIGLAFATTLPEREMLNGNASAGFKQIAKRDIAKGQDVTRQDLERFWTMDDERLVQVGAYSVDKNKYQAYTSSHGIKDGATLYYTAKGQLFVKESAHLVRQGDTKAYAPQVKADIFAKA